MSAFAKILFTVLLKFSPSAWMLLISMIVGIGLYRQHKKELLQDSCSSEEIATLDACVPFPEVMVFTDSIGQADVDAIHHILDGWIDEQDGSKPIQDTTQIRFKNVQYVNSGGSPWFDSVSYVYVITINPVYGEQLKVQLLSQRDKCSGRCLLKTFPITSEVWDSIYTPKWDAEYCGICRDVKEALSDKERQEIVEEHQHELASAMGWSQTGQKKVALLTYSDGVLKMVVYPPTQTSNSVRLQWEDGLKDPFAGNSFWMGDYPEEPIQIVDLYDTLETKSFNVMDGEGFYVHERSDLVFIAMLFDSKTNQLWITQEHRAYLPDDQSL